MVLLELAKYDCNKDENYSQESSQNIFIFSFNAHNKYIQYNNKNVLFFNIIKNITH